MVQKSLIVHLRKNHNEGGKAVSEAIDFIFKEYGVLVVAASETHEEI